MDAKTEIRAIFFEECAEGLEALDGTLAAFAGGAPDAETIGIAYRAVHSLKGGAASFRMNELSAFAKSFEALLGEIRAGRLASDAAVADLVARAARALALQVEAARLTAPVADELSLRLGTEEDAAPAETGEDFETDFAALGFTPVAIDPAGMFPIGETRRYDIRFAPRPSLYASANEASLLIRDVLKLGTGRVECLAGDVPALDEIDPEGAWLAFRIELETADGEEAIRDVFSFVEDDCELEISPVQVAEPVAELPDAAEEGGDALLARLLAAARA